MSRVRIGQAEKLRTVHLVLDGKEKQGHAADRLGIGLVSIQQWICIIRAMAKVLFLLLRKRAFL